MARTYKRDSRGRFAGGAGGGGGGKSGGAAKLLGKGNAGLKVSRGGKVHERQMAKIMSATTHKGLNAAFPRRGITMSPKESAAVHQKASRLFRAEHPPHGSIPSKVKGQKQTESQRQYNLRRSASRADRRKLFAGTVRGKKVDSLKGIDVGTGLPLHKYTPAKANKGKRIR